jgi:hypothetical protein
MEAPCTDKISGLFAAQAEVIDTPEGPAFEKALRRRRDALAKLDTKDRARAALIGRAIGRLVEGS